LVKKTSILTTGIIIGGSILALSFLSKRFDVLGVVGGAGTSIGEAIGRFLAGIPIGIGTGGADVLASGAEAAGEFFKPVGDFFADVFGDKGGEGLGLGQSTSALDVSNVAPETPIITKIRDSFAATQLRPGQTIADITIKPKQGTRVTETNRFVTTLGGRERVFGSAESLTSFIERFNR